MTYYENSPHVQANHSNTHFQGTKYKEKSTIFGVVGFFFLGLVFGPLALINAKKAEELNHSATLGKVLGWFVIIRDVLLIIIWIWVMVAAANYTEPLPNTQNF